MYNDVVKNNLKSKFDNVCNSDFKVIKSNLNILLDFLNGNNITSSILEELRLKEGYINEWAPEQLGSMVSSVDFKLPHDEDNRAALCLKLLEQYSTFLGESKDLYELLNVDMGLDYFNEIFTQFLKDYMLNKIDEGNLILYILNKYKLYCEWFNKQKLLDLYESNYSKGESLLTEDLQKFLFNQGIDFPFSQPETPSGKPDLVYGINTENPLTLEVKLFGGRNNYAKGYIRKGFKQALTYTQDYNKEFGYLLIYNLNNTNLEFKLNDSEDYPHIKYANKIIFLIVVNLNDGGVSASQKKDIKNEIIREDFLISD